MGELAYEAALAGARLSTDQGHAPALSFGARKERTQRRKLAGAPDEWIRRRKTERTGKLERRHGVVRIDYRARAFPREGWSESGSVPVMTRPAIRLSLVTQRAKGVDMSTTLTVADAARRELKGFAGQLIGPTDGDYDEARKVYNAWIDRTPALIARCADAGDVARTIEFARVHDLLLAVRGGGHNGGGLGVRRRRRRHRSLAAQGGLDRSRGADRRGRRRLHLGRRRPGDPGARPRGALRHHLHDRRRRSDPRRRASVTSPGSTDSRSTTCSASTSSLADGERSWRSAEEHPDLFWAVRGGGGNFGVVTSLPRSGQAPPGRWSPGRPSGRSSRQRRS